jgi:hypothetical protein
MKNIYLIPTDKPSRLIKNNHSQLLLTIQTLPLDREIGCFPQNIYITSDEEIKEGEKDFYIIANDRDKTWINCVEKVVECKIDSNHGKVLILSIGGFLFVDEGCKIILTTDQDLIKDGVQAIDYEFLEWYVKNPSCEFVEVDKNWNYPLDKSWEYKLRIIPKEEPKQDNLKELYLKNNPERATIIEKRVDDFMKQLKTKQETLEEAADKYSELQAGTFTPPHKTTYKHGFEDGAKWNAERSYSYEEVETLLLDCRSENPIDVSKWFQQFKKK